MSFGTVFSAAINGLEVEIIKVEADVSNGLPITQMVGYVSSEVKESLLRVRTAIKSRGILIPPRRIMINLSPGNIRKRGSSFDLPVAVSLLIAMGEIKEVISKDTLFIGELGLNGDVIGVKGVLSIVAKAKETGIKTCFVPKENLREGSLIDGIKILGVSHLEELMKEKIKGNESFLKAAVPDMEDRLDFSDVYGQKAAKRCLEIAVSGGHNILLIGPPGSGKTMLAKRVPGIMPSLNEKESLELTKIYSIYGLLDEKMPLIITPPFREVHHTITKSALIGGGLYPKPGEITLSHKGILFLDEITEFRRSVLEVLRQPLEEKKIIISRNHHHFEFPADFALIASCNPCPCGMYPDRNKCSCKEQEIKDYMSRISTPFLDRMDMCIELPKISYGELTTKSLEECSKEIKGRVLKTRELQYRRYGNEETKNALLNSNETQKYCCPGEEGMQFLEKAYNKLNLTARSYHKILKVSRTIADMEGEEKVKASHVKEAIAYRMIPYSK